MRTVVLAAVVAVLASAGARPARAPSIADPEIRELLHLVNAHRAGIGCPELRWDPLLARIARRHSEDMARRGFFAHRNPDGEGPFGRMEDAGIRFGAAAENIAAGQTSGGEVFRSWMGSRGHRANLENCRYTEVGIGRYLNRWTLDAIEPSGPHL